ncbi:MAG TPA: hypothetical protein VEA69_06040 [Tepidisphaeraceae bacterium]|nr:hypothetical protein [Tepidisphaeraceae bacterium]
MSTTATAVRERPILFSGEMVRAILAGRKTQTRRIVKPQPFPADRGPGALIPTHEGDWIWPYPGGGPSFRVSCKPNGPDGWNEFCPYGRVGDRLWVREKFTLPPGEKTSKWTQRAQDGVNYAANGDFYDDGRIVRSSIHMPRWASRLTLEVTDVRVQRVREISEGDAIAEGMKFLGGMADNYDEAPWADPGDPAEFAWRWARGAFAAAWKRINGDGSWESNPFVWAITFKRVDQ